MGEGAHSTVHREERDGQTIALKIARLRPGDSSAERRIRLEAATLARVNHPGVPRAYEAGVRDDGQPYLAMEFIEGESLAQRLSRGSLGEARTIELGVALCDVLGALHRLGLVHRDVKPSNLLLAQQDGTPRLIDFGLVADRRVREARREAVGTFLYAAPEQTGMLKLPVDARADLYALGVLLFECVAGRPPFQSTDAGELIRLHAAHAAPSLQEVCPAASPGLDAIITRLLAKDPDDRYASAASLKHDLEKLADGSLDANELGQAPAAEVLATPLRGRSEEMGQLVSMLSAAGRGSGAVAAVSGEEGTGKTRLLTELASRARRQNWIVLASEPPQSEPLPLSTFKALVQALLQDLESLPQPQAAALRLRVHRAAGDYAPFLAETFPELRPVLSLAEDRPALGAGQDVHYDAVAHLLTRLAGEDQPLLLLVEDAEQVDTASKQVLRRIAHLSHGTPLLLVCTTRADGENEASQLEQFLGMAPTRTLSLGALSEDALIEAAADQLGCETLDSALVQQLVLRSRGNPLSLVEHLHAMLEAGALEPSWGQWLLDNERLTALNLPSNVSDLLLRRLDGIAADQRAVLSRAALLGTSFEVEELEAMHDDPEVVGPALEAAVSVSLLERMHDGRVRFLQERAREVLRARLSDADARELHGRAAVVIPEEGDAGNLYRRARHHYLGVQAQSAAEAYRVNTLAGAQALTELAPGEALNYLHQAAEMAERYSITMGAELWDPLATAYGESGHVEQCLATLPRAVETCTDADRRAELHLQAAELHLQANFDSESMKKELEQAYEAVGMRMPRNRPWLLLRIVVDVIAVFFLGRMGWGLARPPQWKRYRFLYRLAESTQKWAYFENATFVLMGLLFRVHRYGLNAGPSRERIWALASHEITLCMFGFPPRVYESLHERAMEEARRIDDKIAESRIYLLRSVRMGMAGDLVGAAKVLEFAIRHYQQWLNVPEKFLVHMELASNYALRGYSGRSGEVLNDCLKRLRATVGDETSEGKSCESMALSHSLMYERPAAVAQQSVDALNNVESPAQSFPWYVAWTQRVAFLLETEEWDHLDHAIEQTRLAKRNPMTAGWQFSQFYQIQGQARAAQAWRAEGAEREQRLEQLRFAIAELKFPAKAAVYRGYQQIFEAVEKHLSGDTEAALRLSADAINTAQVSDCPSVLFEALVARARMLREGGHEAAARRDAGAAQHLGQQLGWHHRVARLRQKYSLDGGTASRGATGSGTGSTVTHTMVAGMATAESESLRRDRDALLEVSLAASTVFEPTAQAEVALDKLIKILAAERGFLFLCGAGDEPLKMLAGRDRDGNDTPAERLPRSLIDRVRTTRAPLVISGTEEGEALGFESVRAHELRSMICAPLMLGKRFNGVVYLDSSLSKGVFTESDLEILRAIATQIAISQETARSAQREIERHAMEKDLQLTAAVQGLLLPKRDTWAEHDMRLCAFYEPASQAGGDFWFADRLPDGGLRVLVADVTGHGAGAAMVTAAVAGCYRTLRSAAADLPAEDVLEEIHKALRVICEGNYTMPAALVQLDASGVGRWWSAAAPPLLIHRAAGQVEASTQKGLPLGSDDMRFDSAELRLEPGDRLLTYTDGVTELQLPNGKELGIRRLRDQFAASAGLPLQQARAEIIAGIREAQGDVPADDDLTFVLLERAPRPSQAPGQ